MPRPQPDRTITHSSVDFDAENRWFDDTHSTPRTSTRDRHRRPSSGTNAADEDLQRAFQASLQAQEARERIIRQRNEDAAAREAADEAAAIAESTMLLAATQTHAQRQADAADAEMERILRESAAEHDRRKAQQRAKLDTLHASFGSSSGRSQHRTSGSSSQGPAPPVSSQPDRVNSVPRNPAPNPTSQRERSHSTPRNLPAPLQGRTRPQAEPVSTPGSPSSPRNSSPPVASPGASRHNSPGELLRQGLESARRPPGRAGPALQQPRGHLPARFMEMRVDELDSPVRPPGNFPTPGPNSIGRRHSERSPHIETQPVQRASSSSSRRQAVRHIYHGEPDLAIRQAMNNSARYAQQEHSRGGHSRREEEQLRLALQNSLGDAPPPADPTEGLTNPPPGYNEFHGDKKVDPLRFTTTNEKGNEPGYMRKITPEILEIMKKFLIQQQAFDAKAKASGNGVPPANNVMTKQQKRAPAPPASAAGSASRPEPAESLEALLGTRLPAPPSRSRPTPAARAENVFVSRMPGLASDARERIPQSRPWENAFSTIPNTRARRGRY